MAALSRPFPRYESLQYYRIQTVPREHYSPAWFGQEKGRGRPARNQERAPGIFPEFARTSDLGAGIEEIRPGAHHRARIEDHQ